MLPNHRMMSLIALLLTFTTTVAAQEAEAVVKAHLAARGGEAAWANVKTLELSGNFTGFSLTHPFVLQKRRPNHLHMTWTLGENPMEMGFDGELAWWTNPWYGFDWATPMSEVDRNWQRMYHYMATPFFDYQQHGLTMTYLGRRDLDGQEGFVFEFKGAGDYVETWYLDPQTHLEFARVATGSEFGRPAVQHTWFDDFRKVGDLVLPHRIESEFHTRHRVLEIDKVTVNPALTTADFQRPIPKPLQALQRMKGTWQVAVKQRRSPRHPWTEETVTSVIDSELDGLVLRETIHYGKRVPSTYIRAFSYDRTRKQLLLVQSDSFSTNTAFMPGTHQDNQWQWQNTGTQSSRTIGEQMIYERVTLSELKEGSFKVECAASLDDGTTWNVHTELTYQRKPNS